MTTHLSLSTSLGVVMPRSPLLGPVVRVPMPAGLIERTLRTMRSLPSDIPQLQTIASPAASRVRNGGSDAGGGDTPDDPNDGSGGAPDEAAEPATQISMEQLVRDHADAVYRVALSITNNAVLAEDISQDALIKAWQSLHSYRGDAPLRHWILRITHNIAISTLRRSREDTMSPADFPEHATTDRSVDVQVQDRLAIDRFEAALGDLDGVSRSIVVLREVEGMSYGEMSDVLELPLPTIRTRLLRARRQLADALDGWQP